MNNPPAFPKPSFQFKEKGETIVHIGDDGMTLRDYFAIHTALGDASMSVTEIREFGFDPSRLRIDRFNLAAEIEAKLRYIKADAMLAERQKGQG